MKQPKVIIGKDGIEYYEFWKLQDWLKHIGYWEKFIKWSSGDTGKFIDGKVLIEKSQINDFISNKPNSQL